MKTRAAVLLGMVLLALAVPAGAGDILGAQRFHATLRPRESHAWVIVYDTGWWGRGCAALTVRQQGNRLLVVAIQTPTGQTLFQQSSNGRFMHLGWDPGRCSMNTYLVRVWNWSPGRPVTVTVETQK